MAWDASSDPNVTGYNLYYGAVSQQYTNMISATQSTSIAVSNLISGGTYYFAATAVNAAGLESLFSTEVSYQIGGSATAVINLANLFQAYDGTPKVVTASTSPAGLSVAISYNGLTNAPVSAGTYQVLARVTAPGYTGSATNMLTIFKAVAVVRMTGLNTVYDGTSKTVTVTSSPVGLAMSMTYNGLSSAPVKTGSYQVIATVKDLNYSGGSTNTLVISKAGAKVQLSNLTQTYDGTPKTVTATTVPTGLMVTLTYNGQSLAPSRPGSYTVVGTISDPNYYGAATNMLAITKTKGHPIPGTGFIANATQSLLVKSPTPAQSLLISWPPTADLVTILHSTDLRIWIALTNVPGPGGSLTVIHAAPEFFMATHTGPDGTKSIPLSIRSR